MATTTMTGHQTQRQVVRARDMAKEANHLCRPPIPRKANHLCPLPTPSKANRLSRLLAVPRRANHLSNHLPVPRRANRLSNHLPIPLKANRLSRLLATPRVTLEVASRTIKEASRTIKVASRMIKVAPSSLLDSRTLRLQVEITGSRVSHHLANPSCIRATRMATTAATTAATIAATTVLLLLHLLHLLCAGRHLRVAGHSHLATVAAASTLVRPAAMGAKKAPKNAMTATTIHSMGKWHLSNLSV